MNLESVWAYLGLMTLVMMVVALPPFRAIDSASTSASRYASIDGLRGFLAMGVFVFHLVVTHRFIQTGVWEAPPTGFYALLGPLAVSLFFMITGLLFWGKLLRAQGRPGWYALFIGRLFRIGPMYLVVVLAMLGIVFLRTGFTMREPATQVAGSVLQWLALGFIDTQPFVNGYDAKHVLAGVTWTIFYEWAFYASLLGSAYFARGRRHLLFVGCALVVCIAGKTIFQIDATGFAILFLCGMAVASLLHERVRLHISDKVTSSLAIGCLALIFWMSRGAYSTVNAVLLALFFYLVCSGATLFGLLASVPARRLGNISYSLYLMQGLVLSVVFAIEPVRTVAAANVPIYWAVGCMCACTLVVGASLAYAGIERPGINLGRRLVRQRKLLRAPGQAVPGARAAIPAGPAPVPRPVGCPSPSHGALHR